MDKKNICPFCECAIPQKNCGMGLVNCPLKGCGNAHKTECDCFRENSRLVSLREAAIDAIKEFDRLNEGGQSSKAAMQNVAARSCVMTEAFATMLDIGYDDAAEMLREWAKNQIN